MPPKKNTKKTAQPIVDALTASIKNLSDTGHSATDIFNSLTQSLTAFANPDNLKTNNIDKAGITHFGDNVRGLAVGQFETVRATIQGQLDAEIKANQDKNRPSTFGGRWLGNVLPSEDKTPRQVALEKELGALDSKSAPWFAAQAAKAACCPTLLDMRMVIRCSLLLLQQRTLTI